MVLANVKDSIYCSMLLCTGNSRVTVLKYIYVCVCVCVCVHVYISQYFYGFFLRFFFLHGPFFFKVFTEFVIIVHLFKNFFFFFRCETCGILTPQPESDSHPLSWKAKS